MKILPIELAKLISNKETGIFIFLNSKGEFVRVFLKNGEILKIDGLYGEGENEIARLFLWGEGTIMRKDLPREFLSYVPQKKYNINGFLKILVENISKELEFKSSSINNIIFDAYLSYLESVVPFLEYKSEEWIGFSFLLERLSKSIKNSIILVSKRYILFFGAKVDIILSRDGFIELEKIENENLLEPFDYRVIVFSFQEYQRFLMPLTKRASYSGKMEKINIDDYEIGIIFQNKNPLLYVKDMVYPKFDNSANCILWK
ncbi:MAG: hypothetical protein N2504_04865 [candidate division WOR-3 bacterium]|nr:hypothetical protein [candidate division WOR-3 bacterium]MCX7947900.1 hypothetical protein [candidate division WOR-3 bacterium]MDW8150722.1 hypothetical protein [candidate division WOR-3 bacterium]